MAELSKPTAFSCGQTMKNKFMLAPLTNEQSNEDGSLSDNEFNWLVKRATGGFGLVMTCASHVQKIGKGFPGQLGIFSDRLIEGHKRLAKAIQQEGSLAVIQLHHAGMRSPEHLIGEPPVCPSINEKTGARALRLEEVITLKDDFIQAAVRAKECGYNGVEIHGAHGYILSQFLSSSINFRTDEYGGNLKGRSKLLFEIIDGIREKCGSLFLVGVRLSPERFGMDLKEVKHVAQQIIDEGKVDFLDISLWDSFKLPETKEYQNQTLLEHFTSLNWREVKLTVAGNIRSGKDVQNILDQGVDFVTIGRAAILHHDFAKQVMNDPSFTPIDIPVTREYLKNEGLSDTFVNYMKRWPDFVKEG
jgi:2,4-dienoyl-CoA reductase-like NADH-dependent reductase (Old Yellow Enzyme family)